MPQGDIEEIKAKIDIVELVQEYVQLKNVGANWKANCPFHTEKTPSFMVSKEKQIWHCFGCSEGGDVFTFVQKIEGMEFPEALRHLAKKAGVSLPTFNPELQNQKTRLLEIVKTSAEFFQKKLQDPTIGKQASDYLSSRGLSEETIQDFGLGLALNEWDSLSTFLVQKGIKQHDIFLSGMTIKRDRGDGFYDRFRNRIMFPLRDVHGTVVGFGGRALAEDDKTAKYINSPQSLIYDKSNYLYGLDQARQEIREKKVAVVVEGYMDVIASFQAGVKNVVASSGTALTDRQVRLLKRFTDTIALAFDADLAGEDASRRGIDVALRGDLEVKVITLPYGKDPDECIKKDPKAWEDAIGKAQGIMDYTFDRALKGKDLSKVQDKKELVKTVLQALTQIPDPIEQTHYIQKLSSLVRVEEGILRDKLTNFQKKRSTSRDPSSKEVKQPIQQDRYVSLAERIIGSILIKPHLIEEVVEQLDPETIIDERLYELYKKIKTSYTSKHDFDTSAFEKQVKEDNQKIGKLIPILQLKAEHELTQLGKDDFHKDLIASIHSLKQGFYSSELQRIAGQMAEAEIKGDEQEVLHLSEQHRELSDKLTSLSL
ncbi:DNA primase [Patescibacteria group bacterium]